MRGIRQQPLADEVRSAARRRTGRYMSAARPVGDAMRAQGSDFRAMDATSAGIDAGSPKDFVSAMSVI